MRQLRISLSQKLTQIRPLMEVKVVQKKVKNVILKPNEQTTSEQFDIWQYI